jgi:hypothetical protein
MIVKKVSTLISLNIGGGHFVYKSMRQSVNID